VSPILIVIGFDSIQTEVKSDNNKEVEIVSPNNIRHSDKLIEREKERQREIDYDIIGWKTAYSK